MNRNYLIRMLDQSDTRSKLHIRVPERRLAESPGESKRAEHRSPGETTARDRRSVRILFAIQRILQLTTPTIREIERVS